MKKTEDYYTGVGILNSFNVEFKNTCPHCGQSGLAQSPRCLSNESWSRGVPTQVLPTQVLSDLHYSVRTDNIDYNLLNHPLDYSSRINDIVDFNDIVSYNNLLDHPLDYSSRINDIVDFNDIVSYNSLLDHPLDYSSRINDIVDFNDIVSYNSLLDHPLDDSTKIIAKLGDKTKHTAIGTDIQQLYANSGAIAQTQGSTAAGENGIVVGSNCSGSALVTGNNNNVAIQGDERVRHKQHQDVLHWDRKMRLRQFNLEGRFISELDLNKADLRGANLRGANLHSTKLREADLRDTDLCNAILTETDLTDANLRGANLKNATYNKSTIFPKGFDPVVAEAILVDD